MIIITFINDNGDASSAFSCAFCPAGIKVEIATIYIDLNTRLSCKELSLSFSLSLSHSRASVTPLRFPAFTARQNVEAFSDAAEKLRRKIRIP
jgi:hypothetical protein